MRKVIFFFRFTDLMISKFNLMFFCLIIIGVINTSLNFFRVNTISFIFE